MCKQCKTSREFNIELTVIHGNRHNRTGCDLHDHIPVFTLAGDVLPYDKHAVGKDWMLQSLPSDASNKYLYHLSSSDDVELFGAVYDNIAYLYVVRLSDSIPNPEPVNPEPLYRPLRNGEIVGEDDEFRSFSGGWIPPVLFGFAVTDRDAAYYRCKLQPTAR